MIHTVTAGGSIQTAVNGAAPGDTILVRAGIFNENVTIPSGKERLRIIGAGASCTIVDGTGQGADGFTIRAAKATSSSATNSSTTKGMAWTRTPRCRGRSFTKMI